MTERKPAAPKDAGPAGKRLWAAVVDEFVLEEAELLVLREATRTVDELDRLNALARREGLVVKGRYGPRLHPTVVEQRQLRIALARLVAALRLPLGDDGKEPQRRVGARGVYAVRGTA